MNTCKKKGFLGQIFRTHQNIPWNCNIKYFSRNEIIPPFLNQPYIYSYNEFNEGSRKKVFFFSGRTTMAFTPPPRLSGHKNFL